MHRHFPPPPNIPLQHALRERRRGLERERLLRGVRVGQREVVDCAHVRRGAQVLDAGGEAFGAREEEVGRQGFVCFLRVGCGEGAFGGRQARGFGEGDEPYR